MKMSELFSQTRKANPGDASDGHALLVRAGYIRQLAAGIYTLLPLALRVMRRIETIIREELERIGAQEILMPVVNPSEIWKETGRWYQIDAELGRFVDRNGREMALAMTHEEVVGDLVRSEIQSYRQLPCLLFHIQTKWRDDPRPRAGLIRVREFTMTDSYSLDREDTGMVRQYERHLEAYKEIFTRCGLPVAQVNSDTGIMGGKQAHEFMYRSEIGEDTILDCPACDYGANRQVARCRTRSQDTTDEAECAIENVHTPGCATIADLAAFLEIDAHKCAKAVFNIAEDGESERFIIAIVPGDFEVNETKLASAVGTNRLRPATDEEINSHGIVPGFGSPVGAKRATVVVDETIPSIKNMVAGANKVDYHLTGVNYPRDFRADHTADIVAVSAGDPCPQCGEPLESFRAVEVGNTFQLGTRYSDTLGCTYLDADGAQKPVYMGSYGIGNGRLLACIAEEHRDDSGLKWPEAVAPFDIHIVDLSTDTDHATELQRTLTEAGYSVLIDDRSERAGVKFNDADLIGVPIRITVGKRSIAEGVFEIHDRRTGEKKSVAFADAISQLRVSVVK